MYAERRLVLIALWSFLLFSAPHFVFHSFNLEPYTSGDAIANVVTLLYTVVAPVALLIAMRRPAQAGSTRGAA